MSILPVIGSAIGGIASAFGQHSANRANAQNAQAQMDFQERMSNTAYQRAMKDMKKAGLNPILAGRLGGASSPGGAMPNIQNPLAGAGQTAAAVANTALTAAQVDKTKAETALINQGAQRGAPTQPLYELAEDLIKRGTPTLRKVADEIIRTIEDFDFNSAKEALKNPVKTAADTVADNMKTKRSGRPDVYDRIRKKPKVNNAEELQRKLKQTKPALKHKKRKTDKYKRDWKRKHGYE